LVELGGLKEDFAICSIPDMNTEVYQKGNALALEFSKKTGIPFYPLITKIRETKKQHELHSIREKYENVKGAYGIDENFLKYFKNKKIILIDDVTTSLATTNECSKILTEKGIGTIFVFSVGRFILKKEEKNSEESQ
jgi:competence protein ComFC